MSSTHVSLWSTPRNLLKKQKSFMLDSTPELIIGKSPNNRRVLQKQLSVDQMSRAWTTTTNLQQLTPQRTPNHHQETGLKIVANNMNNNNYNQRNKRHAMLNQPSQPTMKNEKMLVKKDSRININIFLGQASNMHENDNFSESEDLMFTDHNHQAQQSSNNNNNGNKLNNSNNNNNAANRRAQFQASRVVETIDTQQKGKPRASSAPLKALSFDEGGKGNVNKANRKFTRRRRALREFQECDEDSANESVENKPRAVKQLNVTTSSAVNGRPRSASSNAGEVETLVSLLSSGGSDSEKEDKEVSSPGKNSPTTAVPTKADPLPIIKHKPPPLRKIGKSVSFQDDSYDDVTNNNSHKELMSLRQNSVNPMPTRARQSRPHNGPLSSNSLFLKELETQANIKKREIPPPVPSVEPETKTETKSIASSKEEPFPDNVQTAKERECYRLYQKMSSMGLNVSFDTVLRGMLTPTELRVIQKKKESELARQATIEQELQAQEENEEK